MIFPGNPGGRGSFVLEIQTGGGGGSCASGNPGERGVKKRPHPSGEEGADFFWNNPLFDWCVQQSANKPQTQKEKNVVQL